ncbi:MAG: anthranilate phosphoribosyltransferase [Chlorobium sp.]|uniref:anthranilate phosphoribosyltransferase n=1 Tax=Chlorobium sp. TaxID=1095 RepID=UPI0029E977C0|nr:anthranilate phosphoribosyltransferase [Chlorobium sp.]MCF8270723.1 anthranilate phosphoribosyltransferase [Chlorobium sp.]MCF8287035.1 anthranilate phosphoribosyltransferase [Chlorobium sp.]MCF8290692.1 anthranilate phosphoribosyltransferase [Chlorobium sp.]MCF8384796.1 anthranilate phosphoribosyltransferase [Chlorobium sp.]
MTQEQDLRCFGKLISAIASGYVMTREESCEAYRKIILNLQPELQQGAFLLAHFMRNPTIEELSGAWDALDLFDTEKIRTTIGATVCDIVGTGSDPMKTLNCSTPASLIASACGLRMAKKGARLVTGVSGASDIFECLGIDLSLPLEFAERALEEVGICYLPGESFLKSGWARLIRTMRFTTAFNILGPLTRPCTENNCAVIGAYAPEICDRMIAIQKEIGMHAVLAPYGMIQGQTAEKGIDEFSLSGPTRVTELRDGDISIYEVTPEDFGMKTRSFTSIASRCCAEENALVVLDVLQRREQGSAAADFFCMNAAAALYIADMAPDYLSAADMAREAIASGAAFDKLEELRSYQGREVNCQV